MKKWILLLALATGVLATATDVMADNGFPNPFGVPTVQQRPLDRLLKRRPLPAFQAAPWYTYWPYNGHFQMSAPLPGQTPDYSGLGGYGGGAGEGLNPYFPSSPRK